MANGLCGNAGLGRSRTPRATAPWLGSLPTFWGPLDTLHPSHLHPGQQESQRRQSTKEPVGNSTGADRSQCPEGTLCGFWRWPPPRSQLGTQWPRPPQWTLRPSSLGSPPPGSHPHPMLCRLADPLQATPKRRDCLHCQQSPTLHLRISEDARETLAKYVHAVMSDSMQPHGLPSASVQGTLQARILEWVAIPFSRGPSRPRDQTCISHISCIGRWMFNHWPTRESSPGDSYKL